MLGSSKAEKHAIGPIIAQFRARHRIESIVVVADADMLSAEGLTALDNADMPFIVDSRCRELSYQARSSR
ncbi:hypothetical protein [Nocardia sp. NPDC058114]|uniref:hypothetical protein n=1 Tax=Nocardia sp. NPDC058114 TaxID=3346346 RepID=UPI0036DC554A